MIFDAWNKPLPKRTTLVCIDTEHMFITRWQKIAAKLRCTHEAVLVDTLGHPCSDVIEAFRCNPVKELER